jgi:hypothetical protein
MSAFRAEVVAEALKTRQLRLYSDCHLTSWEASEAELSSISAYLDDFWCQGWLTIGQLEDPAEMPRRAVA